MHFQETFLCVALFLIEMLKNIAINCQTFSNPPCTTAPLTCSQIQYRTLDGTCNNLKHTDWGAYNRRFNRLVNANYGDKICSLPKSVTGKQLPSARLVSNTMFGTINSTDPYYTLVNMQWGQIVTHDMSRQTPRESAVKKLKVCCPNDKLQIMQTGIECMPIIVPPNDPVYGKIHKKCLLFDRSVTDKNVKCPHNFWSKPAQQISATTSYMDLSLVYGSNKNENDQIRAFNGGRMIVVERGGQCYPPQVSNVSQTCAGVATPNEPCYLTGDIRTNQNPQLAVLQILLLREHNLLADELRSINPHWNDEKLFQVARSINIAQYQHINYYEWLPQFLGLENMIRNKLIHRVSDGKCVDDYQSFIDASILNEHGTGAFRYYHTQIAGYLGLLSQSHESLGSIRLSDWIDRPTVIEENNHKNLLYLSIGLATQSQELSDTQFDAEVKHFLFRYNETYGTDLKSIDIQRGRDHGLATYNDLRNYCGFPRAKSWEDYYDFIPKKIVDKLKTIYASFKDVELSVGGALENFANNTLAGPTFLCIMTEQFYRTRHGDRFFYENCEKYGLTDRQLLEIRKITLASILCRNTDMTEIQKSVFIKSNNLVSCKDIPEINLNAWKE